MRVLPFLLLAGAVAVIAGCVTPPADDESAGNETGDGMTNLSTNETTSISMDFQASGPGPLSPGGETFEVPENATAILLEARWDCTSPTCEISISVLDENGTEVGSGSGNGEATVDIQDPAAGSYTVEFSTQAPTLAVSGEAKVTVFTGEVPDGFTAWEEEEAARSRRR